MVCIGGRLESRVKADADDRGPPRHELIEDAGVQGKIGLDVAETGISA